MGKSTYLQEKTLVDNLVTPGAYLALFTNDPGDDADGDEVKAGGYQRKQVTFSQPRRVKALMQCENTNSVDFLALTGGYGTITHVALFDAPTGGNMLYYTELNSTIRATSDDKGITFPAGDLKVAED